ncbi:MAG: hypothetical protein NC037_03340 [Bacteroides sp.]|nr:hypothetical protein [Bacillota bacterium]MCM1455543.1 hypothetical protein [Bacteroides sp.]
MARKRNRIGRQEAIYQLALAGISAAIALLFVGLSVLVRFSTVAFYVAASVAIMVPLAKRYYLAGFFAYAVAAALGFVIAGDIYTVAGFVAYFGPMALITGIMYNKKVKWYIALPVKVVYINGALALLYFVCHTIMIDASIMDKLSYPIIALVGTIALVLIDYVLQFVYSRLIPLVEKVLRPREKAPERSSDDDDEDAPPEGDSPFDEM